MKAYFKLGFLSGYQDIPSANEFIKLPLPCPINIRQQDYSTDKEYTVRNNSYYDDDGEYKSMPDYTVKPVGIDVIKTVTFKLYRITKFEGEDIAIYDRWEIK